MPPLSRLIAEGKRAIPGTLVFDGDAAQAGYAINAMCYSFNTLANRQAFAADEEGYMDRFHLTEAQREAVRDRNVLGMLAAGGNVYYLAKLAGKYAEQQRIAAADGHEPGCLQGCPAGTRGD